MKISLEWLSDFLSWAEIDPEKIADSLTKGMGEVEGLYVPGKFLENCVVGKVLSSIKHPNADTLALVDVETDRGIKRVVCGGTNLKTGMLVAFAHVGATVKWHGGDVVTLAPATIRGEKSHGMICAGEELGIETLFPPAPEDGERPIVALPKKFIVGTPLKEALKMDDTVIQIDNHAITNRPDLFSHVGVAREAVALGLGKPKRARKKIKPVFPSSEAPLTTAIECQDLVPRYLACVLEIDNLGKTPQWMRKRLEATGWRCVNLPVDITNYVTMELGMPLHSFDLDDVKGDIVIRRSKSGEKIQTLDEVERELPDGAVVLSDDTGIFDLLGIMGGLRSSTKETTKRIYLHSAIVDGAAIRKAILKTGHRTDAATVYEKSIPPITAEVGFYRALELFLELVPGARIVSRLETYGDNGARTPISVSLKKMQSFLGIQIDRKHAQTMLKNLGCDVRGKGDMLIVNPPLWRRDLRNPADIAEEIGRLYGYNRISADIPAASLTLPKRDTRLNQVRNALKEDGFIETLHLAYTSPETLARFGQNLSAAVRIENPLGEELSLMRPNLLPNLLQTASRERKERQSGLALFEVGHVFSRKTEHVDMALVHAPKTAPSLADLPLLRVKSAIAHALGKVGYAPEFRMTSDVPPWMHPSRSATVVMDGESVGSIFELNPATCKAFDVPDRTAAVCINWTAVLALRPREKIFKPLPLFPAVTYDETIILQNKTVGAMLRDARAADWLLTDIETVDVYDSYEANRVTLRFTYRAKDRTLKEDEAKAAHEKVFQALLA